MTTHNSTKKNMMKYHVSFQLRDFISQYVNLERRPVLKSKNKFFRGDVEFKFGFKDA